MKNAIPKLWAAELLSRIFTAVATIYIARTIGVSGYGLIGFVAAVMAYLFEFVRFGTDYIIVRDLSQKDHFNDEEKAQLRTTAIIVRLSFFFLAFILVLFLAGHSEGSTTRYLYWASVLGLLGTILPVDVFLQAEEKFSGVAAYRVLSNVINLALILIFLQSLNASWVVPAASGVGILASETVFFRLIHKPWKVPRFHTLKLQWKYLVGQGLPLFGSMFLLLLVGQLTIVIVRAFCSSSQLGCYVASYKIYDVGNALLVPTATVLFPKLSRVWSNPDASQRTTVVVNGMSITVPLSLLMFGSALLGARTLIPFLFGADFATSATYVSILSLSLFFRSQSMFLANGLVAGGRQRMHLVVTSISVIINVVLGLLLIWRFGAIGGAYSILIAFGCEFVTLLITMHGAVDLIRVQSLIRRILLLWVAPIVPLMLVMFYLQEAGSLSVLNAFGLTIVFAGAFIFLLWRYGVVTVSFVRENLSVLR